MKILTTRCLLLACCLMPLTAFAWWNDQWSSRKQIGLDGGATGADLSQPVADFPLLLRLHTGNFPYFPELAQGGRDLRFLTSDGSPLKHHIERFDAVGEIALVWLEVPRFAAGLSAESLWMYYGNPDAQDDSDGKGLYDPAQALVYHFREDEALPRDATDNATNAADSKARPDAAGLIGAAARFSGTGGITVAAAPQLAVDPDQGWSFSTWIRIDQAQAEATVFQAAAGGSNLDLVIQGMAVSARHQGGGTTAQTPAANLAPGHWHHLAVAAGKSGLQLYVDGAAVGNAAISLVAFNPSLILGQNLVGLMDEVQVARVAPSADWIKLQYRSQSPDFTVLNFGQDESKGSGDGPNYFVIILQSLTVDGWVVIALCGVMFVISALVMVTKGLSISRARKDNQAFLDQYRGTDVSADPTALDHEETEEDKELEDSAFLTALVGRHDHFQSSPIYHIYHAGVQELKKRFGRGGVDVVLTPEALNVIRARLDAAVVREGQKLNQHMVLLTIAISGGPFLGLLGTVLGVMITFAVIAATGDVNINSIAPGISGALLATVAGLAVAIPALFAYNYLLTRIKELTADMQVFTDEFLAMVSERVADRQREPSPAGRGQGEG
ncbi:MAG: MotA/TolQ/ExbB proton channel family protein [Proteobacteria bacterium]|nr:MotA/TolQ/ExbB proton channel family protein [Pseudomonadota bacterium]